MFNNFGTIRTRPSSAHLFEDLSDSDDCELRTKKEEVSKESLIYQITKELASLNLSVVFGASTLFENTIRLFPEPQAMSLKPKLRVPKLTLPYFDGESQNVDRWMAALKQDFGARDMDKEDYPSLCTYPVLENYGAQQVGKELKKMTQCLTWVVSGLYEESIKLKAIENGAMGVTSLEDAINKVNSAVQTLQHLYLYGPQAGIAWKALSHMNQRNFLPNSQAYVSAINHTNSMPAAQIFPSSLAKRYDYSPNAFYQNTQLHNQSSLQPLQVFPPQTSQPVANTLAVLPPSISNINPSNQPEFIQRLQQFLESHKAQQSSRYKGPNIPQQENRPLPKSRCKWNNSFCLHCFKCGELGHPSRECPTPNALSHEERAALYNRYADRVLSSHQRQVNLAEAHQSVHSHMSFDTQRNISNIPRKNPPCSSISQSYDETNESYESDFVSYPSQTYEEATGQKEKIISRANGNAVDSIEVGNDTREHLSNDDQLSFSTKIEKRISEELNLLNFSGSLEYFSVVIGQEKRRSVKEIFDNAHAEVMDVYTSRKRRHIELENLSNSEDMEDNHQFHQ
ncbi:hypothetical protein EPUL_005491, partial [Erysiphe pulchra]